MPTLTDSLKSVIQVPAGGTMTPDNLQALLTSGTDEVFKRAFDTAAFPFQGDLFYESKDIKKSALTTQTTVGLGNIPRNRDDQDVPIEPQSLGFAHSLSTLMYRGAARWTQEFIEDEEYGQLSDNSEELANASRRTVELIMADGINRGTGTAPFLCEDGGYLFDAGRPNPHPLGGTWSNIDAAGAISPSMIFTSQLAFATQNNVRGQRESQTLTDVYVRPADEVEIWEILKSTLRPTDSMNAASFQAGRFNYHVYNLMTTAQIVFRAMGKRNELHQLWRIRPAVEDLDNTPNNVFGVMVRFRFGVGCLRPDMWRQATVS
ncbi:MAG: hypothetical protein O3A47_04155 [Chloroflexi bacterium]|nr:hypothetical protein [Chloroflexota bacterium]